LHEDERPCADLQPGCLSRPANITNDDGRTIGSQPPSMRRWRWRNSVPYLQCMHASLLGRLYTAIGQTRLNGQHEQPQHCLSPQRHDIEAKHHKGADYLGSGCGVYHVSHLVAYRAGPAEHVEKLSAKHNAITSYRDCDMRDMHVFSKDTGTP
jgi:hypothetical protein